MGVVILQAFIKTAIKSCKFAALKHPWWNFIRVKILQGR